MNRTCVFVASYWSINCDWIKQKHRLTFCSSVATSCSDLTSLNLSSLICLLVSPEKTEARTRVKERTKKKDKDDEASSFTHSAAPAAESPLRSAAQCPPVDTLSLWSLGVAAAQPVDVSPKDPQHRSIILSDKWRWRPQRSVLTLQHEFHFRIFFFLPELLNPVGLLEASSHMVLWDTHNRTHQMWRTTRKTKVK